MKLSGSLVAGAAIGVIFGAAVTGFVLSSQAPATSNDTGGRGPGGSRGGFMPAVTLVAAEAATVGKTLDIIGEGRAVKSVALTSEATGIVTQVNIAPGKHVSKGDILLKLDDAQQRIAIERARAQYPIAKANAERYASLKETEAASALEAETAFNNYKAIEADLRAAEFALSQRTIKAPFDGVIGLTTIEAGDYVRAGDPVTTLDDTSSIIVEFAIPQEASNLVKVGQGVTARLAAAGASEHEGRVSAIDSRVDAQSRTLKIEATFENEDGSLIPGTIFSVSTTSQGQEAVSVPGLAIQWDRAGPFVWRRGLDGKAQKVNIAILQRTDEKVLVEGDLNVGDYVVSEGADRVRSEFPLPEVKSHKNKAVSAAGVSSSGVFAAQD
ncbi:efflux RND transporter periplasmic adaptor subunit [Hyphococcus sp. DH-69]|uniref:efflux RND transporter periplasmic adaptor subunit n=1 Tax=Hyphococcus formosus TaxID=3143534 RepID=UPI00398ACADB